MYTHEFELALPAPAAAVSFSDHDQLAVGSDDGSVRIYHLPSLRVVKAIRGLGEDVGSMAWIPEKTPPCLRLWVASGTKAFLFDTSVEKLVLTAADAVQTINIGEDEEDVINELNVNDSRKFMSFATDGGSVGIVDLSIMSITRMKARHNNICSSAKFVPDRPSELLSGGFDSALIHFDFKQNTVLSRFDIASPPPSSGVSLSPPFVLSTSLSAGGLVCATTADGRLWIGSGGDKHAPSADKKKRARKWQGLKESEGQFVQIADGPVVGSAFSTGGKAVITSTLLGKLAQHDIVYNTNQQLEPTKSWSAEVKSLAKVNAIAVNEAWLVVGGISDQGKGVVEVWRKTSPDSIAEQLSKTSV